MKKITPEEKAQLITRPSTNQSAVRTMLLHMKVDEILLIEAHEWTWKSATPGYLCRRVEEKTDMRFECQRVLQPTPGWVITLVQ